MDKETREEAADEFIVDLLDGLTLFLEGRAALYIGALAIRFHKDPNK